MEHPKITVLMSVYNAAAYLRASVMSILDQTFSDFEFLIIDDASTDNSPEILNSINDPRIRVITNPENKGLTYSLNRGIALAKAELIARMDADDFSYPERLQMQYDLMTSRPETALLSTDAKVIAEDGTAIRIDRFNPKHFYYNLNFICWIYHSSVIFRKEVIASMGNYCTDYSEDFDLWWRISRKFKIQHLPTVLIDYRETNKSLSRTTRRAEYDNTQHSQVLRNIKFFTPEDFRISSAEVEALRFNFQPLLEQKDRKLARKFLNKLDYINKCILNTENINNDKTSVKDAARDKLVYSTIKLIGLLNLTDILRFCFRWKTEATSLTDIKEITWGMSEEKSVVSA